MKVIPLVWASSCLAYWWESEVQGGLYPSGVVSRVPGLGKGGALCASALW